MVCKICGRTAVYDLICEADGEVAAELCDGPMCQFDLWRVRPNEPPSCIPLMNGKCICGAALQQVGRGSGKLAFRFNNSSRPVFRLGYHSIERYTDGWSAHSKIVSDAKLLFDEWVKVAKLIRGHDWESGPVEEGKCSGTTWNSIDEGMDVAGEIADVDSNQEKEDCTLWKAIDHDSGVVIGILILWPLSEKLSKSEKESGGESTLGSLKGLKVWRGIRWLVGHPNLKGAGEVLMAKADEMHRLSEMAYMHVIAARSSVPWYKSKGFEILRPSECELEGPCGCQVMVKKA